jgi:hypothetical protein
MSENEVKNNGVPWIKKKPVIHPWSGVVPERVRLTSLSDIKKEIRQNINTAISDFNDAYCDVIEETQTGDNGKIENYEVLFYECDGENDEEMRREIEQYLDDLQERIWNALEKVLPPSFKPYVTWDVNVDDDECHYDIDIGYTVAVKIPFIHSLADCDIDD